MFTVIGKFLVLVNLALSLVMMTVALGVYTHRINWATQPSGTIQAHEATQPSGTIPHELPGPQGSYDTHDWWAEQEAAAREEAAEEQGW